MFRPVKLRQHLALMAADGHPAESVLAGSGLTLNALDDPACLLDLKQYRAIVSNVMALTDDPAIGLKFGAKTELRDLGVLGFLVMSAQTTRQTAQYWILYSHALLGVPLSAKLLEGDNGEWALDFSEITPLGSAMRFGVEEQLSMVCRLAEKLTLVQSHVKLIEVDYSAPAYSKLYDDYLNAPVRFGAGRTRITFRAPRLDHPLISNDHEFHEICARECELLARKIHRSDSMVWKTKAALARSAGQNHGIETVAAKFNVSSRTLRRHLLEEGYSYQQLLDEFRAELAHEYLSTGSTSMKEVAYRVGYQHPSSFHRAFKRWTGANTNWSTHEDLNRTGS